MRSLWWLVATGWLNLVLSSPAPLRYPRPLPPIDPVPEEELNFVTDDELRGVSLSDDSTIARKLEALVSSVGTSDVDVTVASIYGGIFSFAYYFVSVLVGTPPQRQSVILDSGSSLLGFPCTDCRVCGRSHVDPPFALPRSSTASWVKCGASQCLSRLCGRDDVCRYEQAYSEGSRIEGKYFGDYVAIGDLNSNRRVYFPHIGCHDRETNLFLTQKANGILGVSFPKGGAQKTIIDAFFDDSTKNPLTRKLFAICGSEEGGRLVVGGYDSSLHRNSRTKPAPNLRFLGYQQTLLNDANQQVRRRLTHSLESSLENRSNIQYNGDIDLLTTYIQSNALKASPKEEMLRRLQDQFLQKNPPTDALSPPPIAWAPITSKSAYEITVGSLESTHRSTPIISNLGRCVIDSGTTFSYLSSAAFRAMAEDLDAVCKKTLDFCIAGAHAARDKLCWRMSTPDLFERLPSYLLTVKNGAVVEWTPQGYLHRKGTSDIWCAAIDDNNNNVSVLGMSFLKTQDVIFDREKNLIGFVQADCPLVDVKQRDLVQQPAYQVPQTPDLVPSASQQDQQQLPQAIDAEALQQLTIPSLQRPTREEIKSSIIGDNTTKFWIHDYASTAQQKTVLWASAGALAGLGVLAMAAITARSISRRRQYEAMPASDDVEIGSIRPSERIGRRESGGSEGEDLDALERELQAAMWRRDSGTGNV